MHRNPFLCRWIPCLVLIASLLPAGTLSAQNDWSRWRGPSGNGIAVAQAPPTRWGAQENVRWRTPVPGRGHASPIVLGDRIFLATADEDRQTQSVLCFDRQTGKSLWQTVVNEGGLLSKIHPKNTHASSTIATDGQRVFAVFCHHEAVSVTALDLEGKELWTRNVGPYQPAYPFGFGSSPIVHEDLVIVTNENRAQGGISAFDAASGEPRWKIDRGQTSSYSTPVVAEVAGQQQLLISGGQSVTGYNLQTGKPFWQTPAKWAVTCGTLVWDEGRVFASGGFPAQQTLAVDARNGQLLWENPVKVYEQSLLAHDGYVYAHADNSVLYCWRASDGREMWKQRFSNRRLPVSASPVLAGGNLYFIAENGETVVVRATPEAYQEVARNQLGTEAFATPAFCGNEIFARYATDESGSRQEYLICLSGSQTGESATDPQAPPTR